jgi:hypothetical protein
MMSNRDVVLVVDIDAEVDSLLAALEQDDDRAQRLKGNFTLQRINFEHAAMPKVGMQGFSVLPAMLMRSKRRVRDGWPTGMGWKEWFQMSGELPSR